MWFAGFVVSVVPVCVSSLVRYRLDFKQIFGRNAALFNDSPKMLSADLWGISKLGFLPKQSAAESYLSKKFYSDSVCDQCLKKVNTNH